MYNGTRVFDVHGHLTAPGNNFVVTLMSSNHATASPIAGGKSGSGDLSDESFRNAAKRHLDYMEERKIDVQIIGPRPFTMMGWMKPHLLPSWVGYTNDRLFKQCQAFPGRFIGAAQLPQISSAPDLSNCLPELQRCHKEYGFVAAYLSPDPAGERNTPAMDEPYWYPVYEYCQANGLPIIVHGTNCLDTRISRLRSNYQIGFVIEQFIATLTFTQSDVFDKFPELKVIICHGGGVLDRFVREAGWRGRDRDLSRNLFFDSCCYDDDFLTCMIKQRGVDQVCFGTEAPGSGAAIRKDTGKSSDHLVDIIGGYSWLSEEEKVKIFNTNPAKVCPAFTKV